MSITFNAPESALLTLTASQGSFPMNMVYKAPEAASMILSAPQGSFPMNMVYKAPESAVMTLLASQASVVMNLSFIAPEAAPMLLTAPQAKFTLPLSFVAPNAAPMLLEAPQAKFTFPLSFIAPNAGEMLLEAPQAYFVDGILNRQFTAPNGAEMLLEAPQASFPIAGATSGNFVAPNSAAMYLTAPQASFIGGVSLEQADPLFPFEPMDEEFVTEVRGYLTNVIQSNEGNEQRRLLRDVVTGSIRYPVLVQRRGAQQLRALLQGKQARRLSIPLWQHETLLLASISSGATTLSVNTVDIPFVVGRFVLLYTAPHETEIAQIEDIDPGIIAVRRPNPKSWTAGATLVVPLAPGRLTPNQAINWLGLEHSRQEFSFEMEWLP